MMHALNYSVTLWVTMPVVSTARGWNWIPVDGLHPAAQEMVYACWELRKALLVYGRIITLKVRPLTVPQFRITATTTNTEKIAGRLTYEWSERERCYVLREQLCVLSRQMTGVKCEGLHGPT